jgi:serine/threonine-protein kinase HipA
MERREGIAAKRENRRPRQLLETDYLLGVHDEARMGALRFSLEEGSPFLSCESDRAAPPWVSLRPLEAASLAFERDSDRYNDKWLRQLLAPGAALGGARPKVTVKAADGSLWIAKFPSSKDDCDVSAWEQVAHELAKACGLDVPESKLERFSADGSTYLAKRFDRQGTRRIHFSSALALLGKKDGASASDGSSYLELVEFIRTLGASPKQDLRELWKRIVFNMAVTNTDDHLRNHGFLLTKNGWRLSPLYDVNPNPVGESLALNVSLDDSAIDIGLAKEVAPFFGVEDAEKEAENILSIVGRGWRLQAERCGLDRRAQNAMEPAFALCRDA